MPQNELSIRTSEIEVLIGDDRESDDLEMLGRAVELLITQADVDGADDGDGSARHRFYGRTLIALAKHYAIDWPNVKEVTLKDVLAAMIDECSNTTDSELNAPLDFEA